MGGMKDEGLQSLRGERAPAQEELTTEEWQALQPLMQLASVGNPQLAQTLTALKPGEIKRMELKRRALEGLREHGTISHAASAAGVSVMTIWNWRKDDPEFARQVTEFLHVDQVDELHQSMYNIATNPTDKTASAAVRAGEFLLKSLDRDTYGDHQRIESTQTVNHLVQVVHTVRDGIKARQQEALQRLKTIDAEPEAQPSTEPPL